MHKIIALDAMSGDHGPEVVIPAACQALRNHSNIRLILVGQKNVLSPLMENLSNKFPDRWEIHEAAEVVGMDESPTSVLRSKKDSSMRVALNLVKDGLAHACVSAGNTGALMATARFVLKTLPGIDRPAIMASLPTQTGLGVRVLDLGANVDSSPESLFQFAVMGSIVASAVLGIKEPRIGLLNIGEEDIKGNDLVKKASVLLAQSKALNYVGYVEADAIFKGAVDVCVCDGFVGNVLLKSAEGLANLIGHMVKETIKESWWAKLLIIPAFPVLNCVKKKIDPKRHNGAVLLGLNGIVVKSHGGADMLAFSYAIDEAVSQAEQNVPTLIKHEVGQVLTASKEG